MEVYEAQTKELNGAWNAWSAIYAVELRMMADWCMEADTVFSEREFEREFERVNGRPQQPSPEAGIRNAGGAVIDGEHHPIIVNEWGQLL